MDCLTPASRGAVCPPSKTDLILSKFRPIAPKPSSFAAPVSPSLHVPAGDPVDCMVSVSHAGFPQVPEMQKSSRPSASKLRGGRKRKRDSTIRSRGAPARKKGGSTSSVSTSNASSLITSHLSNGGTDFMSTRRPKVDGYSDAILNIQKDATTLSCLTETTSQLDAGFMARAAASAPPSLRLPDREVSLPGGFTEMIRGITGLSTATAVRNLMHQSSRTLINKTLTSSHSLGLAICNAPVDTAPLMELGLELSPASQLLSPSSCRASITSGSCKTDQSSLLQMRDAAGDLNLSCIAMSPAAIRPAIDQEGFGSTKPDLSGACTAMMLSANLELGSASSHCTQEDAVQLIDKQVEGLRNDDSGDDARPVTLSLLPEVPDAATSSNQISEHSLSAESSLPRHHDVAAAWDQTFSCSVYSSSPEPVALMDENYNVLCFNNAYHEAATRRAYDRQGASPSRPAYCSLGTPVQLGKFCSPGLWGFSKYQTEEPVSKNGCIDFDALRCNPIHTRNSDASNDIKRQMVAPLPLRLIGSCVSLVSIEEVGSQIRPLRESLEVLKQRHEGSTCPVIISNASNVVKWVNTAYKQMIGQPECPWLMSLMGDSLDCRQSTQSPRLMGEVVLICSGIDCGAQLASTFAGWVNVQWTNYGGEKSSVTLPCDVARAVYPNDGTAGAVLFVWKLDIQASLRLTCGG